MVLGPVLTSVIPRGAVVSLAAFPDPIDFDETSEAHRIGFRPKGV